MTRTVFFFFCFVVSLLATTLLLALWQVCGLLGLREAQGRVSHYTSYYWARLLLKAAGVRVTVTGAENVPREGPVLFVSNHQGNFDIPVLLGCINKPKGFLAKIELAKIPILRSWMNKMGCVFIDRADLRQSLKAVQQCAEVVRSGQSMVIFPEGTRSQKEQMGEFKKGSLRLVEKVQAPIVPLSINGTYRAMEANNGRIRPAEVEVTVSPAIYPERLPKEERAAIAQLIRKAIEKSVSQTGSF